MMAFFFSLFACSFFFIETISRLIPALIAQLKNKIYKPSDAILSYSKSFPENGG